MSVPERVYPARRTTDLIEVASQTEQIKHLGQTLIASGLLPDGIKKPEAAMLIMLKGREIGLDPVYALSHISVINGKPAMSAEGMLGLVLGAGHIIRVIETSSERCVVDGVRGNDPNHVTRIVWTMDDARKAGLAGGNTWKKYPRALLRARAISELCRTMFADTLSGVSYVPEELGAAVNEDGEVTERPAPVRPLPSSPASFPSDDGEMDLDDYLKEIVRVHVQIEDHSRPPIERVMDYASQSKGNARRSLAKLRKELEASTSRGETEDVPDMDEADEADEAEDAEVVGDDGNPHEKALPAGYRSGFDPDSYDIPDEDLDTERKENPDELQGR